ncbi:hypothetical protein BS78_06G044100 [Paspalum vaginatum]|nr:hypothetical protein BS78_06G044100 [Paspalum vaginatum]
MAPKKKTASERRNTTNGLLHNENALIPSPFVEFRKSTISESDLLRLVDMNVLPANESWEEAPTQEKTAEVDILLKEIADLKEKGLTAQAVVIDFVFRSIQPLKDQVYLAYLYVGASDPTRETSRVITEEEVQARVDTMLRGDIDNEGTPQPYSVWNLIPSCDISKFLSDPPQHGDDQVLNQRSQLSPQEMKAVVAATQGEGNNEAATFNVILCLTQDEVTPPGADTKEGQGPEPEGADPTDPAPEHTDVARGKLQAHAIPKRTHTKDKALRHKQECSALREKIQKLHESCDGFERSFRETASTLRSPKLSHKLTQDKLENKNAELTTTDKTRAKIQKNNLELEKILNSTREALKDSQRQLKELDILKKNCDATQKNCEKLKAAYEREKDVIKSTVETVSAVLHICALEIGTSRPLADRLSSVAEDIKIHLQGELKSILK